MQLKSLLFVLLVKESRSGPCLTTVPPDPRAIPSTTKKPFCDTPLCIGLVGAAAGGVGIGAVGAAVATIVHQETANHATTAMTSSALFKGSEYVVEGILVLTVSDPNGFVARAGAKEALEQSLMKAMPTIIGAHIMKLSVARRLSGNFAVDRRLSAGDVNARYRLVVPRGVMVDQGLVQAMQYKLSEQMKAWMNSATSTSSGIDTGTDSSTGTDTDSSTATTGFGTSSGNTVGIAGNTVGADSSIGTNTGSNTAISSGNTVGTGTGADIIGTDSSIGTGTTGPGTTGTGAGGTIGTDTGTTGIGIGADVIGTGAGTTDTGSDIGSGIGIGSPGLPKIRITNVSDEVAHAAIHHRDEDVRVIEMKTKKIMFFEIVFGIMFLLCLWGCCVFSYVLYKKRSSTASKTQGSNPDDESEVDTEEASLASRRSESDTKETSLASRSISKLLSRGSSRTLALSLASREEESDLEGAASCGQWG